MSKESAIPTEPGFYPIRDERIAGGDYAEVAEIRRESCTCCGGQGHVLCVYVRPGWEQRAGININQEEDGRLRYPGLRVDYGERIDMRRINRDLLTGSGSTTSPRLGVITPVLPVEDTAGEPKC